MNVRQEPRKYLPSICVCVPYVLHTQRTPFVKGKILKYCREQLKKNSLKSADKCIITFYSIAQDSFERS